MKKFLIALIILILAGGGYHRYINSPEYSLNLIRESIESHDWAELSKRVDISAISGDAFGSIVTTALTDNSMFDSHRFKFVGIDTSNQQDNLASVQIKLHDNQTDSEKVLELEMQKLDDGTWKIVKIPNLKQFLKGD
ncbi:MAG: hypothetical protein IJ575_10295 [Selenomonadaceae bacterium]|nr:hypothetical protein [Selenomonadaceae bacterium]